jgi:protoheme ferro-lyase
VIGVVFFGFVADGSETLYELWMAKFHTRVERVRIQISSILNMNSNETLCKFLPISSLASELISLVLKSAG